MLCVRGTTGFRERLRFLLTPWGPHDAPYNDGLGLVAQEIKRLYLVVNDCQGFMAAI